MNGPEAVRADVPVLAARGIGKRYGALRALEGVSFEVYEGEVLGLIGDNGAGKSTLLGILAGAQPASAGTLYLDGTRVVFTSPLAAHDAGIEVVYQDLALAMSRDVASNMYMGRELVVKGPARHLGWLDRRAMQRGAAQALVNAGIPIQDVRSPCEELSGGQRQGVAVARAMMWGARVLLLDEPTAALALPEQKRVAQLIAAVAAQNVAVVLVSHNLPQVLEIADRIIVLRQGSKVADVDGKSVDVDDLIGYITGARVAVGGDE